MRARIPSIVIVAILAAALSACAPHPEGSAESGSTPAPVVVAPDEIGSTSEALCGIGQWQCCYWVWDRCARWCERWWVDPNFRECAEECDDQYWGCIYSI
jgi:hypothetical protein